MLDILYTARIDSVQYEWLWWMSAPAQPSPSVNLAGYPISPRSLCSHSLTPYHHIPTTTNLSIMVDYFRFSRDLNKYQHTESIYYFFFPIWLSFLGKSSLGCIQPVCLNNLFLLLLLNIKLHGCISMVHVLDAFTCLILELLIILNYAKRKCLEEFMCKSW